MNCRAFWCPLNLLSGKVGVPGPPEIDCKRSWARNCRENARAAVTWSPYNGRDVTWPTTKNGSYGYRPNTTEAVHYGV